VAKNYKDVVMYEEELTYAIRGCVYDVFKQLGAGFLENVYEQALLIELVRKDLKAESQKVVKVYYKDVIVGKYVADIIVEQKILLELKAVSHIRAEHKAQILNYLKATGIKVGLLINFSHPKAEIKRYIL